MVFGVSVMFIHQMIAYILFMMPVFHIAEKVFGVHESSSFLKKISARLIPGQWMCIRTKSAMIKALVPLTIIIILSTNHLNR